MFNYKTLNNITGWIVFAIAAVTYTLTLEPTGSFWDCGEFISAAYKLEVVHQPGAPVFLMIVRLFTLLAGDDVTRVAYFANFSSGLASAFTILFLFWTITALAKKLVVKAGEELSKGHIIAIMGSGIVGALAFTFSDSFWFSAVEGEVYAMSALCTAIVFWAILKWENVADEPHADRWLIFIAYVVGLSIGVHLLNLLAIPTIVFVYYFKKYKISTKGIFYCGVTSVAILAFIQYGVISYMVTIASKFDLVAVNTLGMPFGSGAMIFAVILIGGLTYSIIYSIRKNKVVLNIVLVSITFVLIGFSSFTMLVIRAKANPNLNNSDPSNVFSLLSYLNREQYGDRPLLYGQSFMAKLIDEEQGSTIYRKGTDKYESLGNRTLPIYEKKFTGFLPRLYSNQPAHVSFYKSWLGLKEGKNPTFGDNIKFLFGYQMGHMYWRYFMWNFAGRQNDIQGHGNITDGNWISGIKPLDAIRLGNQDYLPKSMTENKAYNRFYLLPFLLGVIGLLFQFKKSKKDILIVGMLFFFTGIAIVLYLNQYPYQPRERDYAYAGSFYAFAIWIGLGVLAIYDKLKDKMNPAMVAGLSTAICLVAVPGLMAKEGWNDHDRSNKYTSRDLAYDYLNSCEPNAILFTMGDNDTYPLWYAQEVENIRPDVRVVNLSLLGIDWYINQMRNKMNDSDPVPFNYTPQQYITGKRDYIPFYDMKLEGYSELKDVLDFMGSDNQRAQLQTRGGDFINFLPTKSLKFTVDKKQVLATGTVKPADSAKIVPVMEWKISRNGIFKNDLMVLDLIQANNWKRPIYFSVTMPNENYLNLENYFRAEGMAYRLQPMNPNKPIDQGMVSDINIDEMYNNMINKFKFGNMTEGIYLDPETVRMTSVLRSFFYQLATACADAGKMDSCVNVLDKCQSVLPPINLSINSTILQFRSAELYYRAKSFDKGNKLINHTADYIEDELRYLFSLDAKIAKSYQDDIRQGVAIMQELVRMTQLYGQEKFSKELEARFKKLEKVYMESAQK